MRWIVSARLLFASLAAASLILGGAAPAAAHARLERSVPASGEILAMAPAELRLVFSEAVAAQYTSITLFTPAGGALALPAPSADSAGAGKELYVALPSLAAAGTYRVAWRTVADDGHVVSGEFAFTLRPPAASAPVSGAPAGLRRQERLPGPEHRVSPKALSPFFRPESLPNGAARWFYFVGVLGITGAATFLLLMLPGAGLMPTVQYHLGVAVRRFGAIALLLLLVALPLRLWLESAALHGPELALQPRLLGALLVDTNWGRAWAAQLLAAVVALLALLTGFRPLLLLAALALAAAAPFQGHAAAAGNLRSLALAADGVHVLAAGAWIGSLAVLVTTVLPVLFRGGLERGGHDTARVLARFSPVALGAAFLLAVAGTASALLHLHSARELVTTDWGRALLIKLGLVLLVLAAGWYNWKRARPALPLHTGVRALRRATAFELLFATAALAVTAALVALPTP